MAYTPPANNAINFTLQTYTAPAVNDIDFELAAGVPVFDITVNQTMPAPSQAITGAVSVNALVVQTMPTPEQAATGASGVGFIVAQTMPIPSQDITAETIGGVVARPGAGGPGAFSYYPPVYAVRTRGYQSAPAPRQGSAATVASPRVLVIQMGPRPSQRAKAGQGVKATAIQATLIPYQIGDILIMRAPKARYDEEQAIMMLMGIA
jgi:hypothetical protein